MIEQATIELLEQHGIKPSAQRLAVANYVLHTEEHPTADRVWAEAKRCCPMVSRATVYNTLNLMVEKGLLRQYAMHEGRVVFDPNTASHHHFIDEKSGKIFDVPWDQLDVQRIKELGQFEVRDYQVVMRGHKVSKKS
jgi:Fe2+ or Zn2+ uptake regulation protein